MDFSLSEAERDLVGLCREFAQREIAPRAPAAWEAAVCPTDLLREMGALGLIGADLPERYGGLGAPSATAGLAIEAVSHADINVGYVPLLASLNGQIIARHASPSRSSPSS